MATVVLDGCSLFRPDSLDKVRLPCFAGNLEAPERMSRYDLNINHGRSGGLSWRHIPGIEVVPLEVNCYENLQSRLRLVNIHEFWSRNY